MGCAAFLLALLAGGVGVYLAKLGLIGTILGLLIATTKALLVAVVFMELRTSSGLVRLFAAAGICLSPSRSRTI